MTSATVRRPAEAAAPSPAEARAAVTPAPYLPVARAHADALVTLFEIEKLFYELAYELRNRPAWAPIPLAGIARVLGARGGR